MGGELDFDIRLADTVTRIEYSEAISDENKEFLLNFKRDRALDDIQPPTIEPNPSVLKVQAEHVDTPFDEMNKDDVKDFVEFIHNRYENEYTMSILKRVLWNIFKWMNEGEHPRDTDWIQTYIRKQSGGKLPDPQPLKRLRRHVPVFDDPERCIDAVASLVEFGETRGRVKELPSSEATIDSSNRLAEIPPDTLLTWEESEGLLEAYDLEPVRSERVTDPEDAVSVAESIGYPVVLKVDSRDIAHRKANGGLALDLRSPTAVRDAFITIRENVTAAVPEAIINGVLVQPQRPADTEVFIGAARDGDFGPIVTVGAGGSMVESSEDRIIRLAPIDPPRSPCGDHGDANRKRTS